MRPDITKEEALSLLQNAALEPLGILVYASDPTAFIQALYRARKNDPTLHNLQIRQTSEGIAICHPQWDGHSAAAEAIINRSESDDTA